MCGHGRGQGEPTGTRAGYFQVRGRARTGWKRKNTITNGAAGGGVAAASAPALRKGYVEEAEEEAETAAREGKRHHS